MTVTDPKGERRQQLEQALAQVATLGKASVLHGHPSKYYALRRPKWINHDDPELRFPEPLRDDPEEYDLLELATWDARRLSATPQGRARTKENTT